MKEINWQIILVSLGDMLSGIISIDYILICKINEIY